VEPVAPPFLAGSLVKKKKQAEKGRNIKHKEMSGEGQEGKRERNPKPTKPGGDQDESSSTPEKYLFLMTKSSNL